MGNLFETPLLLQHESCHLEQIPQIPEDIQIYSCQHNQIQEINNLPKNLIQLYRQCN